MYRCRNRRTIGRLVVLAGAAALALLTGCATSGFAPTDLHGIVFGAGGTPLAGARVTVAGHPPVTSDVTGRFVVARVHPGGFTVTAERDGYEAVTEDLVVRHATDLLHLRLYSAGDLASLAETALARDAVDSAVAYARRGLQVAPDSARLHFLLALCWYRGGDQHLALETLGWFPASGAPEAVTSLRELVRDKEEHE